MCHAVIYSFASLPSSQSPQSSRTSLMYLPLFKYIIAVRKSIGMWNWKCQFFFFAFLFVEIRLRTKNVATIYIFSCVSRIPLAYITLYVDPFMQKWDFETHHREMKISECPVNKREPVDKDCFYYFPINFSPRVTIIKFEYITECQRSRKEKEHWRKD